MTSDAEGNVYVAGTTSSPDLPVKNAAQPTIGESVVMRSLDRGATWQRVSNPPTLPLTITPHPSDPQTLFVGSTDGIYKTSDGGQSWRKVYAWAPILSFPNASGDCCYNIAIDPANTRYAYVYVTVSDSSGRLLVSIDGGESWQARVAPTPIGSTGSLSSANAVWVDPNGSGTVALGTKLSRDHGLTWMNMALLPNSRALFTVPDPRHAGWIYAESSAGVTGRLYLSQDWGTTWTERSAPALPGSPEPLGFINLSFDSDLANTIYSVGSHFPFFYISDDAGASWHFSGSYLTVDYGLRPALLSRQCMGGGLFAVSAGAVFSSFDFGLTWQPTSVTRAVDLAAGPGCALYAVRKIASDAFVAKLGPGGSDVLWSTFLGGSDADYTAAIAVDGQGNVYVAGNTASADFPATAPRIGPQGRQNGFAVKLDSNGNLVYSAVFGGESSDTVTGLAVNSQGEAFLSGWTNSASFPVTHGAFQTQPGSADGFAVKLGSGGGIAYASYLTNFAPQIPGYLNDPPPRMVAVVAEASGSALVGGDSGALSRIAPDGSSIASLSPQAGQIFFMETDQQGNTYVAGLATDGSSMPCYRGTNLPTLPAGDVFVTKLQSDSLAQIYSARISGRCQSRPAALRIGPTGEAALGVWSYSGDLPVRNPVLLPSTCGAAVARLSADGSSLVFASGLDGCQTSAVATAPDGSMYAGAGYPNAGVVHIPAIPPGGVSIEGAANAFSGNSTYLAPGMLLTISGENLAPAFIDLGLNDPHPLPTELGGVRVLFDDTPAEMLQAAPDHVICVVPAGLRGKDSVLVQVVSGSGMAMPFALRLTSSSPGFLTNSFPSLPPAGTVDGNIRNADGTVNNAGHPAAPGSTVTLFATGLSGPGAIDLFWNAPKLPQFVPTEPIYALSGIAHPVPGLVNGLYAIDFRIPDAPGPGVYLVPTPGVLTRAEIGTVGSGLGVYVK